MSRSSVAAAVLGALTLMAPGRAQNGERVLETIRNLEASIGRLDDYIRSLKDPRVGPHKDEEISRLRESLAAEMRGYAERAEAAEAELATVRRDHTELRHSLDEAIARQAGLEREAQNAIQRAEAAEAELATASRDLESVRQDGARLQQSLDDAIARQQAAEDARADVVDRVPTPVSPVQLPVAEGGIQIHIHGGEVTFHIDATGVPRITPVEEGPRDTSNLHLRLRQDGDDSGGGTTPPVPLRRIHLP